MKVQIEGNFYIESDSMQFIIREYTGNLDKHGEPTFKTIGYFPSVKDCLNRFLRLKVSQSTATTLTELVEDVRRIEQYIERVMPV